MSMTAPIVPTPITNDPGRAWRIARPLAGIAVLGSLALLLGGVDVGVFALRVVLLVGLVGLAAALLQGKARKFFSGPAAYMATFSLFVLVVLAIFATEISPQNPYDLRQLSIMDGRLTPGSTTFDGSMTFHLGTDEQGRDILSGILYGLRVSLSVSIIATLIAMLIGVVVGIYAAWAGGRIEAVLMRIVDF